MRLVCLAIFYVCLCASLFAVRMPQDAYVWQRSWDESVSAAVVTQADVLSGLTVLVDEYSPDAMERWAAVCVDADALLKSGLPVTLALRVNYSREGVAASFRSEVFDRIRIRLESFMREGIDPVALEIDFDCPTSKLEVYRDALIQLRRQLGDLPISITTLPTWMNRPDAFRALVEVADHFVLQVHSIQRPDTFDAEVQLCDPARALNWVRKASTFGVRFKVALPTYAYRLGYDEDGELIEVAGENASSLPNPDWRYRSVWADPNAMSSLVSGLEQDGNERMERIIWYRLPIGGERFNWDPQTWRAVMTGKVCVSGWKLEAAARPNGLTELRITNKGAVAKHPPVRVLARWSGATALAWDGQRNYAVEAMQDHSLHWVWPESMPVPLLEPQTEWTLGWVRFDDDTELQLSIIDDAE